MVSSELMHIDVVVVGPTASGKTLWAFDWACQNGAEIISADSRQIYREMEIGTAKPPDAFRREVVHHLLDIRSPEESYSAGQFVRDARTILRDIRSRGKKVVLVGGTGLYVKALLFGLADLPPEDASAREVFLSERADVSTEHLYDLLAQRDPERASAISSRDRYRILRALWLFHSCGRTPSRIYREQAGRLPDISWGEVVGLAPERKSLYERINERVLRMFESGWIEEVRQLREKGYGKTSPGFRSLGYPEILDYLSGVRSYEETLSRIQQKTRQFAKRQITWFRHMMPTRWIS
jgi:tRNA dimethylallyltransferase